MRDFLFNLTSKTGQIIVVCLQRVTILSLHFVRISGNLLLSSVALATRGALMLIDSDRFSLIQACHEQRDMNIELLTIAQLMELKEDALAQKVWTQEHTETLQILGSRLINECDWHESKMHAYMKTVVESIPGLQYIGGPDDDEDDESSISID